MMTYPPRATRHMILRRALLTFAVLTAAAGAVVTGFAVYLFIGGYSGANDPQSVSGLLFPIALLIFGVVGVPLLLACAASLAGYRAMVRKDRQLPR